MEKDRKISALLEADSEAGSLDFYEYYMLLCVSYDSGLTNPFPRKQ